MPGYPQVLFAQQPHQLEPYECSICCMTLRDPVICTACGFTQCKGCREGSDGSCPHCRRTGEDARVVPNRQVQDNIELLPVWCETRLDEHGAMRPGKNLCNWKDQLCNMAAHLTTCPCAVVCCELAAEGCTWRGERQQLAAHHASAIADHFALGVKAGRAAERAALEAERAELQKEREQLEAQRDGATGASGRKRGRPAPAAAAAGPSSLIVGPSAVAAAAASPAAAPPEALFGAAAKKLVEAARRPNTPNVLQPLHEDVADLVRHAKDEAARRALWAEARRSGLLQLCRERCAQTAAGRSSTGRSTRNAPDPAAWWRTTLKVINNLANRSAEDAIDLIE